jgi:hypothetical protein
MVMTRPSGRVKLIGKREQEEEDQTTREAQESQLVDEHGGFFRQSSLLRNVVADVAKLLLDLAHSIHVGSAVESVPAQQQQLDQIPSVSPRKKNKHKPKLLFLLGDGSSCNVETASEMRQREALVHRHNMSNTVATVANHSSQQPLCIPLQKQKRLDISFSFVRFAYRTKTA